MNIKIKATNVNLSEEIKNYLEKRVEAVSKMIDINNPTLLIEAELGRANGRHQSGDIFKAEVNLTYEGEQFRAVAETGDLYSAIDKMRDSIVDELRSFKGKRHSLLKRGGARIKGFIKRFYR